MKSFTWSTGPYPVGSLIEKDGKLYGMTKFGGVGYCGVIFSCNMDGSAYSVLKNFSGSDGAYPWGCLLLVGLSIPDAIEDLISQIEDLDLETGLETSLTVKLENALNSFEDCLLTDAVNQLTAFINQVQAQRGKKIPIAEADELIAQAQEMIDYILENGNPDCPPPTGAEKAPLETDATGSTPQLDCFPNPSDGTVNVRYYLPEDGWSVLVVYDLEGRLVRTLSSKLLPAGEYFAEWDGLDSKATPVAPGAYLLRLQTEGNVETETLVRIR